MIPPEYRHADLLHSARRLWKRMLPDCSQGTVETAVLGIDRTGDIPGAMAPDIWFSFLKNGNANANANGDDSASALLKIAEHNRRDITGLAAILRAMTRIADNPLTAMKTINFDLESLAIRWHAMNGGTGQKLLQYAAETGHPRAALHYALALIKAGQYDEGREWLLRIASAEQPPLQTAALRSRALCALALRALAIDSEHRLKDAAQAIAFTEQALELLPPDSPGRKEFERRLLRLRKKTEKSHE
jgi:tetratricopeptide (TPR) repeat protein